MFDTSVIPVLIFAGGRGARFDHESQILPKPLIKVAGKPILDHIINQFVVQGFKEFIVASGYLHNLIDKWAIDRKAITNEDITIRVINTGLESSTGVRLALCKHVLNGRMFVMTYGDGLSDVSMQDVIQTHKRKIPEQLIDSNHPALKGPLVTITAVNPPNRFGVLRLNGTYREHVLEFKEKSSEDWINGGFMVCEFDFIEKYVEKSYGCEHLEDEALPNAARDWMLKAHRHYGYWQCMDSRRDLELIENDITEIGEFPWGWTSS